MTRLGRAMITGIVAGHAMGLAAVLPAPARAETVAANRDSYFYAAPAWNARVLDEVQRAVTLDLRACAEGWCRVGYGAAEGYVPEAVVRGPANAVAAGDRLGGRACFDAAQPGGGAWQTERFCHTDR